MLTYLFPDLKLAFRMLLKKPMFTLAALVNLAIGIGVNTAIFSVVNAVLLQPLPYTNPNELVFVFTVLVRSANTTQLSGMIKRNVMSIDKDQPISQPALMETVLADKLSQRRLNMWLLGVFGAVALVLALVGIYGVISYTVTQRTHELDLRMALGAQPFHILKLIVGHGMSLAVIGIVIGLIGALWLSQYLTTLVFGISVKDPITFVGSAALLFIAALIACYIPARRALRVYPMQALRHN